VILEYLYVSYLLFPSNFAESSGSSYSRVSTYSFSASRYGSRGPRHVAANIQYIGYFIIIHSQNVSLPVERTDLLVYFNACVVYCLSTPEMMFSIEISSYQTFIFKHFKKIIQLLSCMWFILFLIKLSIPP
jgi:hypothetical protein